MKRNFFAAIFCLLAISFGGCNSMDKELAAIKGKDGLFAIMETSDGNIVMELFYKETPLTVTNFVGLAEGSMDAAKGKPFYDGLKFHRVISKANGDDQDFMIQGGDPQGTGAGGPGYRFADEIVDGLTFDKPGYLAMANAGAGTNGSQFFITIIPTEWLNGKHTIFGKVVNDDSQNVVNNLKKGALINKITIVRQGDEAKKFTASQADFDRLEKEIEKANAEKKEKQLAAFTEGCTKDSNGIFYKVLKEGSGSKIGSGKNVMVEYKGYFADGSIFDGSSKMVRGGHAPLEFKTGAGQMIKGFDIMVQDMKVGETRKMVLPPEFAYGKSGIPGVIPGGAFLAFDVEVTRAK